MKSIEVQILSQQDVKPSASTPSHLRTFQLSLLDQLLPSPYAPTVWFYPMNENGSHSDVHKRLELLKNSLSKTLTHFYPLAGKMKTDTSIDCNDQGANYLETRVNCHLSDFLHQPDLTFIHDHLLPCPFFPMEPIAGSYVTNIQMNVFECGGIAVGVCISHKILDGAALCTFLRAWTTVAHGSKEVIFPNFTASSLFPANDLWLRDLSMNMWGSMMQKGHCVTKRFVFDASAISNLKKATSSCVTNPTRVEVITALLWKSIMEASEQLHGFRRPCSMTHLVNLRKRMEPTLSDNSLGNLLWIANEEHKEESKPKLEDLVTKVRKAISDIDEVFVQKLMTGKEGYGLMSESIYDIIELCSKDGTDNLGFSSWCKLGYYEADFGWGKPVWVSSFGLAGTMVMNLVILNDTRSGDGIETWVTLDEPLMATLEGNTELLNYAAFNPSPLSIEYSSPE